MAATSTVGGSLDGCTALCACGSTLILRPLRHDGSRQSNDCVIRAERSSPGAAARLAFVPHAARWHLHLAAAWRASLADSALSWQPPSKALHAHPAGTRPAGLRSGSGLRSAESRWRVAPPPQKPLLRGRFFGKVFYTNWCHRNAKIHEFSRFWTPPGTNFFSPRALPRAENHEICTFFSVPGAPDLKILNFSGLLGPKCAFSGRPGPGSGKICNFRDPPAGPPKPGKIVNFRHFGTPPAGPGKIVNFRHFGTPRPARARPPGNRVRDPLKPGPAIAWPDPLKPGPRPLIAWPAGPLVQDPASRSETPAIWTLYR